jgi:hypothetical protein
MVVFDFLKKGSGIFIVFGFCWWRRSHGVGDECEVGRENENKQKKNIGLSGGVISFDREGAGIRKAKIKG